MIHDIFDKKTAINISVENDIINIDKLLVCNDFETIKNQLIFLKIKKIWRDKLYKRLLYLKCKNKNL